MGFPNGEILMQWLLANVTATPKGTRNGHPFAPLQGRTKCDHLRAAALRRLHLQLGGAR